MKRLAILGAGGHGKVIADAAELTGWDKIVFYDDIWPQVEEIETWKIEGNTLALFENLDTYDGVIVGFGENIKRLEKLKELIRKNARVVSVIHPMSIISKYAKIGNGSVVMAGAVINIGTTIGMGNIVNTNSSVDHDCKLSDGVHISPGACLAGNVKVEECSWVGIGASIRQSTDIGKNVIIGAGAAVVNDVSADKIVAGIPARELKNS